MPDAVRAQSLRRARRLAGALLAAMAAVLALARAGQAAYPALSYLVAFAEAALAGGIADWFAVTALFRQPFGLPLPHTAIIPKNKERIGQNIGDFLQYNFMTHDVLREELQQVDFAGAIAAWLTEQYNRRTIATHLASALPAFLRTVEDEELVSFLRRAAAAGLADIRFAPLLAQVLDVLVTGRQHTLLLQRILGMVARALDQYSPYIRQKVHENSPRWLPRAADEQLFVRLVEAIRAFLIEVQADAAWRARFEAATRELITNLENSPEYENRLRAMVQRAIAHPLFHTYLHGLWQTIRERLLSSAASADSALAGRIELVLGAFGRTLAEDLANRSRLNEWMRAVVIDTIVERRDVIAAVVWRVIRKWDAETISGKLELQVGRDLQYVRINGTLVGGAVGLLLHVMSKFG
jgi:uncharacterized membrane-anchored protein YjiN (DUF445 family)